MILTLQTTSFGWYGGIPSYNRLVCRVLNDFDCGARSRVLIAMDDPEAVELQGSSHPNLQISAFGGQRLAFVKTALSIVVRERVELILAGHINYVPLCVLLRHLQPQMRFGVFVYGREVWDRIPLLRRWALQQADFVISISSYTKEQAVRINGLRSERVFLLPNALEWTTNRTSSSAHTYSLLQGTKLLSVGRLDSTEQQKGFDTVIESLSYVAAKIPSVQYIIIGTGTDLERHKQLAATAGVSDRVQFLGSVDEELLRHYYSSCDVFVMPSAQEGFRFVYIEAMEYGKPIVAAKSGGAPEVVQDGVTGILVEYGDKEQLAQALIDLCLDSDKCQRLGQAGYQRLQENFTFPHFKQKLTEILLRELPPNTISKFTNTDA